MGIATNNFNAFLAYLSTEKCLKVLLELSCPSLRIPCFSQQYFKSRSEFFEVVVARPSIG